MAKRDKATRLLQEARERVLSGGEMDFVIDWVCGSQSQDAIMFSVARPAVKPAVFVSLLTCAGFDTQGIKSNLELFVALSQRKLDVGEMDTVMRAIFGADNECYIQWDGIQDGPARESLFLIRMIDQGMGIPMEIGNLYLDPWFIFTQ